MMLPGNQPGTQAATMVTDIPRRFCTWPGGPASTNGGAQLIHTAPRARCGDSAVSYVPSMHLPVTRLSWLFIGSIIMPTLECALPSLDFNKLEYRHSPCM